MECYYINFCGRACSLAAEKAIYPYLKDNYDGSVISESAIQTVVDEINAQIEHYFISHKGQKIECCSHRGGPGYYVNVGQLYMTLIKINHEIGVRLIINAE